MNELREQVAAKTHSHQQGTPASQRRRGIVMLRFFNIRVLIPALGMAVGLTSATILPAVAQVPSETKSEKPETDLTGEVARLVRQLEDASQAKRDAAEKGLVQLGPDILPQLPTITVRTPAETKERLGRVRQTLETMLSNTSAQPTTVTLQGEMSLNDAFAALEKQTGNRVADYERRSGTTNVNVSFDKVPYLKALDEVLDQADLDINVFGGEPNALVLMARPEGSTKRTEGATYAGVFRFEPLRVEARRDLRNSAANGMRIAINVSWEPRVAPISLRQPIDKISLVDAQGNALNVGRSDSQSVLNASAELGMSAVELGIPLELPPRSVEKIASLKGTLTALVPGRMEKFEFADLEAARDVEQRRAGVSVTFERLRKNVDLYEVRIRVRYDEASNALESHRSWIYGNPAYIVDAKGERVANLGANEGGRDENEVGIVCLFDLPQGPRGCRFVYQTPATLLQLPVEYELKDIPLP